MNAGTQLFVHDLNKYVMKKPDYDELVRLAEIFMKYKDDKYEGVPDEQAKHPVKQEVYANQICEMASAGSLSDWNILINQLGIPDKPFWVCELRTGVQNDIK